VNLSGNVDPTPAQPAGAAANGYSDSAGLVEYISFAIGEEQYGVEIMAVREIKGWSGVKHLPNQPSYVRGVLNLRGVVVPIIDLRARFNEGNTEASLLHVVLIVQIGEVGLVGLLADRVLDIVSIETSKIQPVPRVDLAGAEKFLSGLITANEVLLALIDLDHLLPSHDVEQLHGQWTVEPSIQ
jgi:purine-binding chemotaxis protein CheW